MKYFEFGQEHPELMVMLHGGGTSYRGMLPTTQEMARVYHVVLVAYDGFNPDEPETEFRSPMDEAKRLGIILWSTMAERSISSTASPTAAGSLWRSWRTPASPSPPPSRTAWA